MLNEPDSGQSLSFTTTLYHCSIMSYVGIIFTPHDMLTMVNMMITNWLHFGYSLPSDASINSGLGWLLLAPA